jgi:hypothetical protein
MPQKYVLPRFVQSTTVIDSSTNREKHTAKPGSPPL